MEAKNIIVEIFNRTNLRDEPQQYELNIDGVSISDAIYPSDEDDMVDEEGYIHQSNFAQQKEFIAKKVANSKILHKHQIEALQALVEHKSINDISLVILPTGAGKSAIAFLAPYILGVASAVVITPSITITTQLMDTFSGNSDLYEKLGFWQRKNALQKPVEVKRSQDLKKLEDDSLIIVNAQKFGTQSAVDIGKIPNDVELVIIDEAHHYPATTWDNIVKHFCYSRKIFLTATPCNRKNELIVPRECIAYDSLSKQAAVTRGILRPVVFTSCGSITDPKDEIPIILGKAILRLLEEHDKKDYTVTHQAIILTRKISEAIDMVEKINTIQPSVAVAYCGTIGKSVVEEFKQNKFKIIVVCGRLLEGFDRSSISVAAIHRNVQPESRVLFTQFVGRCIRMAHKNDPVTAHVVSHVSFSQESNFNSFDTIVADNDPVDDKYVVRELGNA